MKGERTAQQNDLLRLRVTIRGAVQGVGFRPFIYRLARMGGLAGWVRNSPAGVVIEAEGVKSGLDAFLLRVEPEKPALAAITSLEYSYLDPVGYTVFEIRQSEDGGDPAAVILPDIATCPDCLREIFDPADPRYHYPFANCTNCGPRFTIIESLPYDRHRTTMKDFSICPRCRSEYEDPADRRFHAQPIACPDCGPRLELWGVDGRPVATCHDAMESAAGAIRDGMIVAVRGLGGFHLVVDARNEDAVVRLRARKRREEKPLALMFPSEEAVRGECEVSALEGRILRSAESPIVLLSRKINKNGIGSSAAPSKAPSAGSSIAPSVAPGNPNLGVMLPYTPLHHILMSMLGFPVVATSGNLTDEPICTGRREALERLRGIAELFLMHDRPIRRHVDDSIVRVMMGRELVLRRARGYAPLPVRIPVPPGGKNNVIVAVGAHLKNATAVASGENVFIGQHIGDLETGQAYDAFRHSVADLRTLFGILPESVGCDMHPAYISTAYARTLGTRTVPVQHHLAHVASCMAENALTGDVLGVSWDGTGYGPDGTIWGGEFFLVEGSFSRRIATLRSFTLPGGDRAVREPRRSALGLLFELMGEGAFGPENFPAGTFSPEEEKIFGKMLLSGVNSPRTSSAGRLFDAAASLIGLRQHCRFEGQAAMEMEFLADRCPSQESYPVSLFTPGENDSALAFPGARQTGAAYPGNGMAARGGEAPGLMLIDWGPLVGGILRDIRSGEGAPAVSARFHNTLAEIILKVAQRAGVERVVLTGGCFQNKVLTERTVRALRDGGFRPYWHQRVPPNDGGIALGQVYAIVSGLAASFGSARPVRNPAEISLIGKQNKIEVNHVPGHTR